MSVIIVIIANSVRPIDLRRFKLRQKMNENVYNSHDKNEKGISSECVCMCERELLLNDCGLALFVNTGRHLVATDF